MASDGRRQTEVLVICRGGLEVRGLTACEAQSNPLIGVVGIKGDGR
jgi:hypothetical protein